MRLVRSQVIAVKSQDYVAAARAWVPRTSRILTRHILPNAVAPVLVYSTITVGCYRGRGDADLPRASVSSGRRSRGACRSPTAAVPAPDGAAPGALPEHHPVPDRDGVHHDGRRAARRPRPEAAFVRTSSGSISSSPGRSSRRGPGPGPVLEVDDLHVEFRTRYGVVNAVNGDQLHRRPGRDAGDPRRVRLRQVGLRPGDHGHPRLAARGHHRRRDPVPAAATLHDERRGAAPQIRGPGIAMIFQDALSRAEPGLQRRLPDRRDVPGAPGHVQEGGQAARRRADGPGPHPGARRGGSTTTRTSSPAACASAS